MESTGTMLMPNPLPICCFPECRWGGGGGQQASAQFEILRWLPQSLSLVREPFESSPFSFGEAAYGKRIGS